MQAPLQLPGYTWDPATKRFFKQQTSAAKLTPAAASRTASSSRKGDQLTKGESSGRQRKRAKRTRDKGKARAEEPRGVGALRSLDLGAWDTAPGRRLALHQCASPSCSHATLAHAHTELELRAAAVTSARRSSRACRRLAPCFPTASSWTTRSCTSRSTRRPPRHSASALRAARSRTSPSSLVASKRLTPVRTPSQHGLPRAPGRRARQLPQRRAQLAHELVLFEQDHEPQDVRRPHRVASGPPFSSSEEPR